MIAPIAAAAAPGEGRPYRRAWHQDIMGMPISIHVLSGPAERGRTTDGGPQTDAGRIDYATELDAEAEIGGAVEAVFDELRRLDRILSTYRLDSEITRLADGVLDLAECGPEVRQVMDLCALASQLTRGAFDAHRPLPGGGRRLDPTGLVKGWAVERAAQPLRDLRGADWYVNAGGDILAHVASFDRPPLRSGIEDPRDRQRLIAVVETRDGGVATSGTAARGRHIWDPRTGAPATALASVTVAGPTLTFADVLATAVFVDGAHAAAWAAALGYEVVVVHHDGRAERTLPPAASRLAPTADRAGHPWALVP